MGDYYYYFVFYITLGSKIPRVKNIKLKSNLEWQIKAAANKINKYSCLSSTHHLVPIAIETGGSINLEATEFLSDRDSRISQITMEPLETQYLFQMLSISLQREETKSHFATLLIPTNYNFCCSAPFRRNKPHTTSLIFMPSAVC